MAYTITVEKHAEIDILESFYYYESQQMGLGEKFILSIDNAFLKIASNSNIKYLSYKDLERYVVSKFPFAIYFKRDKQKKEIKIISVLHMNRSLENLELR